MKRRHMFNRYINPVKLLKGRQEYDVDEKLKDNVPERFPVQEAGDSDNRTSGDSHRVLIVQNLRERDTV